MKTNLIALICFVFLAQSCAESPMQDKNAYVLSNLTLIDPVDGLVSNKSILIEEGSIAQIIEAKEEDTFKGYSRYDFSGKFVIPGLWDAHVHYAFNDSLRSSMNRLFLAHGITSVRDTGGPMEIVGEVKKHALANATTAPNVFFAGPLIDGTPNVYNNSSPSYPLLSIENKDSEEIVENTAALIASEVDFLKAYEMLTEKQFKSLTKIAKEQNLKVTGHIPLSMNLFSAVEAGLNGMEHLRNLEMTAASNAEALQNERLAMLENTEDLSGGLLRSSIHQKQRIPAIEAEDAERFKQVAQLLEDKQVVQTPTLILYRNYATKAFKDPSFLKELDKLPEFVRNEWAAQLALIDTTTDKTYSNWMLSTVKKLRAYDIPFMTGTDTPIGFLIPGKSLHRELELFVKTGFSTKEALQAATINPASFLGLEQELGRVKEGYRADLLILDANPLDDIKNTQKSHALVKEGRLYSKEELNAMLNLK